MPPFPRRSFLQCRAARAVLKRKLILAFVDAVWGGGAAALVQFLRSDSLLARRYRVNGESCAGRLLRKNIYFFFLKDITAPRQRGLSRRVTSGKGLKQKSEFIAYHKHTSKSCAARVTGKAARRNTARNYAVQGCKDR